MFELPEDSPPIDRGGRTYSPHKESQQVPKKKMSGRVLALAVVAVAVLLVFVGVVAIFAFRPTASTSYSNTETESLQQQLNSLRQLVSRLEQRVNNTYASLKNDSSKALQLQVSTATQIREEMRYRLHKQNESNVDLQQMLVENITITTKSLEKLSEQVATDIQRLNHSTSVMRIELDTVKMNQLQQYNESIEALKADVQSTKQLLAQNITNIESHLAMELTLETVKMNQLQTLNNSVVELESDLHDAQQMLQVNISLQSSALRELSRQVDKASEDIQHVNDSSVAMNNDLTTVTDNLNTSLTFLQESSEGETRNNISYVVTIPIMTVLTLQLP